MSHKTASEVHTSLDGPWWFRAASFVMYYCVAVPVVFLIGKLVFGLKIKGRHNLKGVHGALVAANHCQYIEPGISGVSCFPRKILFSAEENNVTRQDIGWLTRLLRAFGIPDQNPMAISGFVKKALDSGWLVHFYPEGHLSWRSQEPGPFFEGVFFFSFLNNVPVIPITEVLKERPLRRLFPWWPPKTTFVIGAPIYPEQFDEKGMTRREKLSAMSNMVHQCMENTITQEGGCKTLPERRPYNGH